MPMLKGNINLASYYLVKNAQDRKNTKLYRTRGPSCVAGPGEQPHYTWGMPIYVRPACQRFGIKLLSRLPLLMFDMPRTVLIMSQRANERRYTYRRKMRGQFKSAGRGARGHHFGRQPFHPGQQNYPYAHGGYPGTPATPGHQGGDSFLQAPGDESYDYQQLASDDSHDTQQSVGDPSQTQAGFHGAFGNGSSQQQIESRSDGGGQSGEGGSGLPHSPPDIKYEVTPMPFMKTNDFELIEIDPDDEDDI